MTISVLMSVYESDQATYLNRALQSVWDDQSLKPNQIVLIEDGPLGEDIHLIIDQWKTKLGDVVCHLKSETNQGLTKSLNYGIKHVSSDLIARMDSDDISEPDRFERQANYLKEHPDIDIVVGSLREFNDNNLNLRVRHYPLTHEDAVKYICKASPLAHPTVMMRRRLFDRGLRYNEKYRMCQDIALWFDVIMHGYRIANVPEVTIKFRIQGDVFKRRSRAKAWNEFKIYINGIYRMNGLMTMKYRYPIARLCFRLMPPAVVKTIYASRVRSKFLEERREIVKG